MEISLGLESLVVYASIVFVSCSYYFHYQSWYLAMSHFYMSFKVSDFSRAQVLAIEELFQQRVTNVVFMGMGEPMLNLKAVLEAHQCLNKVHLQLLNAIMQLLDIF